MKSIAPDADIATQTVCFHSIIADIVNQVVVYVSLICGCSNFLVRADAKAIECVMEYIAANNIASPNYIALVWVWRIDAYPTAPSQPCSIIHGIPWPANYSIREFIVLYDITVRFKFDAHPDSIERENISLNQVVTAIANIDAKTIYSLTIVTKSKIEEVNEISIYPKPIASTWDYHCYALRAFDW